jgi:hypothetical protein
MIDLEGLGIIIRTVVTLPILVLFLYFLYREIIEMKVFYKNKSKDVDQIKEIDSKDVDQIKEIDSKDKLIDENTEAFKYHKISQEKFYAQIEKFDNITFNNIISNIDKLIDNASNSGKFYICFNLSKIIIENDVKDFGKTFFYYVSDKVVKHYKNKGFEAINYRFTVFIIHI